MFALHESWFAGIFPANCELLRWQVVWRKNVLLNFSKCILLATWVTYWMPYVNDFVTRRSSFCGSNLRQISPSPISCLPPPCKLQLLMLAKNHHGCTFSSNRICWVSMNVLKRGEKGGRGGCFIGSQRLLPLVLMQGASCKKMASLKRSKGRCCCVHFLWFIHQW